MTDDEKELQEWLAKSYKAVHEKSRYKWENYGGSFRFWSKYFRFGHSQSLNDWWVSIGRKGRYYIYYRKANHGTTA